MQATTPNPKTGPDAPSPLKRRGLLLGAGAATAAAAVGALAVRNAAPVPAAAPQARADEGDGYRLSEHVRRYYETART